MKAIEIQDLSKIFKGNRGKKVQALNSVCLSIEPGEVFGFLGPNGAGKSTTIKLLMGMIRATAGTAKVYGVPVSESIARSKVGFLPENPSFYDFLTAREYLAFVGKSFGMAGEIIARETDRVLDLLELKEAANRPIRGYSKGMVQRLGLAQALLHDPDLYILDEPMSGLDPIGRALVKDIIRDLKAKGKTVFFSTHITSDVEIVCDRVGIITRGVLQAVHNVSELLQSGIEGYFVHITGSPIPDPASFSATIRGGGVFEVFVPRPRYQEFMEWLFVNGGTVELVEPKRRSLEAYFLEVVAKGEG